jgi:hypothetical protein
LGALLGIGGREAGREQVAQGVDGDTQLRAVALLVPIEPGPVPALGRRLHDKHNEYVSPFLLRYRR